MVDSFNEVAHPFESAGLGTAPYKFDHLEYREEKDRCEFCKQPINYLYWILAGCGTLFTVGSECVKKVDRHLSKACAKAYKNFQSEQSISAEEQAFYADFDEWRDFLDYKARRKT